MEIGFFTGRDVVNAASIADLIVLKRSHITGRTDDGPQLAVRLLYLTSAWQFMLSCALNAIVFTNHFLCKKLSWTSFNRPFASICSALLSPFHQLHKVESHYSSLPL